MTQHSGPVGPEESAEDDDYGPPDWFAAVAGPGAESPARRRVRAESVWDPAWSPEPAPERARAVKRPAARPADVDGLGLVQASELPAGRRRRRSALEAESGPAVRSERDGRGEGAGSAGHGGAADLAPEFPDEPPARRSGRTRRAAAPGGREHDGAERAPGRRGAGRGARTEEPADPESRARDICLRLLTGAAKSRKQLADALRKREIPDEVAEEVLTRLEEVGLIDDAAFARAWVESRHSVRGLSRRALAQELRTKGISGDLAEQALAQLDHDDEAEAARALVDRRLRATRGLERQTRTRRLVGLLARRGYSEGLAFRVVRDALDAEGAEDEDEYGDEGDGYED
ncbi:regulatory protein [Streptomyces sp. TLI_053]|uniref:regulatory protein RecX n=1 Tax=Streptomyces sp. TLI_053 TaxID=1855352 RepID=UPI000879B44A|nr:regulatory protein [Streptomyces sp. TLI_053]